MSRTSPGVEVRRAVAADAAGLAELEEAAFSAALGHVFDPAVHAFPRDEVRARWTSLVHDPDVVVEVVDGESGEGPLASLARDGERVRHVAVRPGAWGTGLARVLLERAVEGIRAGGRRPVLWCLAENHRARGLYEHLGWRTDGVRTTSAYPPHPEQLQYVLDGPA